MFGSITLNYVLGFITLYLVMKIYYMRKVVRVVPSVVTTHIQNASLQVRKQGIVGVQGVFSKFRKITEDYLVQKGISIKGNLSDIIEKAYNNGLISLKEKMWLIVTNKAGNQGVHKHAAEEYLKGQGKIPFRMANKAARNLGVEPAAYM